MSVIGKAARGAAHRFVAWLLPAPCLGCGELLEPGPVALGLCRGCRGKLERPREPCPRCGRPRCPGICGACRLRPPATAAFAAAWVYRPPLDQVVLALKFRGLDFLAPDLARGIVGALARSGTAAPEVDCVVPVPLHWRRRLKRGFNQAECLADPVARALGVRMRLLLSRPRATPAQASLGRQARLRGPVGAFRARRRGEVRGARILLIDDVATTGATLEAAARELMAAGARQVLAGVVARTP